MLVCENCESPRHLRITSSRTAVDDNHTRVLSIREEHLCHNCGLEGTAEFDLEDDSVSVSGGLVRSPERPVSVANATMGGSA